MTNKPCKVDSFFCFNHSEKPGYSAVNRPKSTPVALQVSHTLAYLSDGQIFAISISEDFVTNETETGSENPKTGPLERDNPFSKPLSCIEGPKCDLYAGSAQGLSVSLLAIYRQGATIPSIFLGGQEI